MCFRDSGFNNSRIKGSEIGAVRISGGFGFSEIRAFSAFRF